MITRRQFVLPPEQRLRHRWRCRLFLRCGDASYDAGGQKTWRSAERAVSDRSSLQRELVRYATLAPSSHNTQCWTFALQERRISIVPDFSRRCPAVDPDDHHLFVSLGCAAENLIQAAWAHALMGEAAFEVAPTEAVNIALEPTKPVLSRLFEAIPMRQCTRTEFDGKPLSNEELRLLEQAGTGNGDQDAAAHRQGGDGEGP